MAGGVDDQPASRWLAANRAGKVYELLDNWRRYGDKADQILSAQDQKYYLKVLDPLVAQAEADKAKRSESECQSQS